MKNPGLGSAKGASGKPEIRIFVSYSHADAAARTKLETHLAALKRDGVAKWFDGDMDAGDALDTHIARALRQAHIFVALLSPEYLASHYCWKLEFQRAMTRRAKGTMRVVAAVVRPCDWKAERTIRGFKLLPEDGRSVTRWRSADEAYLNIAEGIRGVVKAVRKEMALTPAVQPNAPTRTAKGSPAVVRKKQTAGAIKTVKIKPAPTAKRAGARSKLRKPPVARKSS